jgi:hypothetical protein
MLLSRRQIDFVVIPIPLRTAVDITTQMMVKAYKVMCEQYPYTIQSYQPNRGFSVIIMGATLFAVSDTELVHALNWNFSYTPELANLVLIGEPHSRLHFFSGYSRMRSAAILREIPSIKMIDFYIICHNVLTSKVLKRSAMVLAQCLWNTRDYNAISLASISAFTT